jgi:hypothetical protein
MPSSRSEPAVKGGPTGPSKASSEAAPLTAGERRLGRRSYWQRRDRDLIDREHHRFARAETAALGPSGQATRAWPVLRCRAVGEQEVRRCAREAPCFHFSARIPGTAGLAMVSRHLRRMFSAVGTGRPTDRPPLRFPGAVWWAADVRWSDASGARSRLDALLEPAAVSGHLASCLAADTSGTSSMPMPCPSKSTSIVTRARRPGR